MVGFTLREVQHLPASGMASCLLQGSALTLTALGLAPGAAHLLQLPVKLTYAPELYAQVTSTLYAWYGVIGGFVQVGALVLVSLLALQLRRTPVGHLALASAAALAVSLALWGAIVAPVNAAWADALESADFVSSYSALQARWEYGHLAAFIAWLTGWFGLVGAVTRLK